MLFIDCISTYLSSIAPASLYAVCRLYSYLLFVKSSTSAIRLMETVLVSSKFQLRYTLYVDCISMYLSSTAPAPLYAVFRLYQYLCVFKSSSSSIRCLKIVSVSICRQKRQLSYMLFIDFISIYLSSTAPAHLYAVYRLYQYLSVVKSSSSFIRSL